MPRRPRIVETACQEADTDALAAASIIARVAAIVRIERDEDVIRHLEAILQAAYGIQARAIRRKEQPE